MTRRIFGIFTLTAVISVGLVAGDQSLFTEEIVSSAQVKDLFSFIQGHREGIIEEWIRLTEIPAPSGHEKKRAAYMERQFKDSGLDMVNIDKSGNVVAIWKGEEAGKTIVLSAHMDTVFQGVFKIEVVRDGNLLKAPGIGDDTASLVNLLWTIRALKAVKFQPVNTYIFLATVGEETGFDGMRAYMAAPDYRVDLVVALDGDLGGVHYGALGFGGGRITFRGPGAHTMLSRGVPNPNLAVAKAVTGISALELPAEPLEKWTILNIGLIRGGRVRNAVSEESYFTVDLRSINQAELEKVQKEVKRICLEAASEVGVEVSIELDDTARAHQIPWAGDSFLVKTLLDILDHLGIQGVKADPLGSTEANIGVELGILSVNLGRTYGKYKHTLQEEAEIDGLFLAMKQILLLISCLETS